MAKLPRPRKLMGAGQKLQERTTEKPIPQSLETMISQGRGDVTPYIHFVHFSTPYHAFYIHLPGTLQRTFLRYSYNTIRLTIQNDI